MDADHEISGEIVEHYEENFDEAGRLSSGGWDQVELLRTQELIRRYLPEAPASIIDIGGGPGVYAEWLTGLGYEVHLVDPVPKHVDQAREPRKGIAKATIGDARNLEYQDGSFDAALMLGPLYHLVERTHRLAAIAEAARVVKPARLVLAAAINRFASAIDALHGGTIDDPAFRAMVDRDLEDGVHLNTTGDPRYFTTAYFHRADELEEELVDAGLREVEVLAVEGIAWAAPDLEERMADPQQRAQVLGLLRKLEREETLFGASGHLLAVGRTPDRS